MSEMAGKTIGIDLGTTYSRVAVWHEGQVKILANDHGNKATPNYAAFTDTERLLGDSAKQQEFLNPKNTVFDFKRLIGQKLQYVEDEDNNKFLRFWPFQLAEKRDNNTGVRVNYDQQVKEFHTIAITAMILEKMKETAEQFLDEHVTGAVVTVPASFNDAQRQSTIDAADVAGFTTIRLINEPTAAAIAYAVENRPQKKSNILVYSLGGGSLDVSVVKIVGLNLQVLSTAGDPCKGGMDLDVLLVDHILNANRLEINDTKSFMRFRNACEKAKKTLSLIKEAQVEVDGILNGNDFTEKVTLAQFEDICDEFVRMTTNKVEDALGKAELDKDGIDDVLMVGGSTYIPKIRHAVRGFGQRICRSVHPEEAAVCGAALQAAVINGENHSRINGLMVEDIVPMTLRVEITEGNIVIELNRDSNIPFPTELCPKQGSDDKVIVDLRSSEHDPPPGEPEFEIYIDNNSEGILTATVVVSVFGQKKTISDIKLGRYIADSSEKSTTKMTSV